MWPFVFPRNARKVSRKRRAPPRDTSSVTPGSVAHSSHRDAHPRPSLTHMKTFPNTMPHTKRPLLLAALALVAFAAACSIPPPPGTPPRSRTMDPPKEDALLMPTDAEADPAATSMAAKIWTWHGTTWTWSPRPRKMPSSSPSAETLQAARVLHARGAGDRALTRVAPPPRILAAEGPFTLVAPVNEAFTKFTSRHPGSASRTSSRAPTSRRSSRTTWLRVSPIRPAAALVCRNLRDTSLP